jgi:hypothetical protein
MNLFKRMFGQNRKETGRDSNSSETPSLEECTCQMALNLSKKEQSVFWRKPFKTMAQ